jgi:hypothetical protein
MLVSVYVPGFLLISAFIYLVVRMYLAFRAESRQLCSEKLLHLVALEFKKRGIATQIEGMQLRFEGTSCSATIRLVSEKQQRKAFLVQMDLLI